MTSYQNVGVANCNNNLNENWENDLWANIIFPNHSGDSDVKSFNTETFQTEISQTHFERNRISSLQTSQVQMPTSYQNVETSSLLSPTWEDSAIEIPHAQANSNCTNMSTYFSTFNPSYQSFESLMQSNPVTNTTSTYMKTQNLSGNKNMPTARISLVPTGNGNFKTIVKRKRKRTVFTTEQIEALEEVFSVKPYVTRDERQVLVDKLQVNDKSVKIWFQNRRLKNKRGDYQENMQEDNYTIFDRIDTVESKIIERTDEYGYVTLDDKIVTDLVNVIDDYFSSNVSPKQEADKSPIYEPISPASTSDYSSEENTTSWQHYENNNSIQELIDIQSIIST